MGLGAAQAGEEQGKKEVQCGAGCNKGRGGAG